MIQPVCFDFNPQTAATNPFQHPVDIDRKKLEKEIYLEFRTVYVRVQYQGVKMLYLPDTEIPPKPDALFSNNWVSTHRDGTMVLYPMMAPNRRPERRLDVIDKMREGFEITRVIDLSYLEHEGKFLEGTGSLVFDHVNKFVYACLSPRTHPEAVRLAAEHLKHEPVIFNAFDRNHRPIYHTNMMLSIGPGYAVICADAITDLYERRTVLDALTEGGFEIIEISLEQMERFAANIICTGGLWNNDGRMIAMSWTAYDSFTDEQKAKLRKYGVLKRMDIPLIEKYGGGGVRCLITEIFPTTIYRMVEQHFF
ncbi:MAG: amidinotransferase [Flavobacteriales bacterium]|nr:amidinotransferase [Flavobacteriales bacterium]